MTQSLSGLQGVATPNTVGNETPQWDFPMGEDRVPEEVRTWFLRYDAGPSQLNEFLQKAPASAIDKFRSAINMGVIKPRNEAATNISRGYGGLRAGDQTLLGPMINNMPEGLTPEYWAVVINKAQQVANERIAIMDKTGYFEGVPTMDRQRMEADITNQIAQTEIQRRLADNTIRATDMDEAYRRDAMAQDMRQNIIDQFGYDPGPQGAAGAAAGNAQASIADAAGNMTPPIPGSTGPGMAPSTPGGPGQVGGSYGTAGAPNMTMKMGEQVGWQYVPGSGWQQTIAGQAQDLSEQQQAFAQQAEAAKAASNPRDYIYAQMLGNSRGGLNGMPATNQLTPTVQSPQTWMAQNGQMPGAAIGQNVGQFLQQPGQPQPMMSGVPGPDGQMPQVGEMAGQPAPGTQNLGQPNMQAQGFQAPGTAGAGMQGMQPQPMQMGMPGGMPQQTATNQVGVSAFANALNRNRLVPGSGAIQGQGAWKTMQEIGKETNPMKWRAQDFMRGNTSERQQALGTASAAGFSDEDTMDMMKKSLPTFKAPGAGAMV